MNHERSCAETGRRHLLLPSRRNPRSSHGALNVSLGFYVGMGILLLLLVAAAVTHHGESPIIDQHANPTPAGAVPVQVVVVPGSNLYHAGTSCPYIHGDAQSLSRSEAFLRGLVPCPYCAGNSSARLTPFRKLP